MPTEEWGVKPSNFIFVNHWFIPEYTQFLRCQTFLSRSVCIVWYFVLNMKYMCRTCQKPCNDIIEHIKKVHGFSESYINDSLKTNTNSYKNSFTEIKWLRKNPIDIMLVVRINRKDVKRRNQNEFSALLTRKFSGLHIRKF